MSFATFSAVARRWWWTLLAATVVAAIAGYSAANTLTPTYESRARLLIGPINTDFDTLRASGALAETYAELVLSSQVLTEVADEIGTAPETIIDSVRATADSTTRIIFIRATAEDPNLAAAIAEAVTQRFVELPEQGPIREEGEIRVVDRAVADPEPIAPNEVMLTGMAAAAGLIAAVLVALLLEYLGDTLLGRHQLTGAGAPIVVSIPAAPRFVPIPGQSLVITARPHSKTSAAYRLLAARLTAGTADQRPLKIVVESARADEGAGDVAANLAGTLTEMGRTVALLDANDTERRITQAFGLWHRPGVFDLLSQTSLENLGDSFAEVIVRGTSRLYVIPCGRPDSLVDPLRASELLAGLGAIVDTVVVNGPPILESGGGLIWASASDAAVLLAVRDVSQRSEVLSVISALQAHTGPLTAVALAEGRIKPRRDLGARRRIQEAAKVERGATAQANPASGLSAPPGKDQRRTDRRGSRASPNAGDAAD